MKKNIRVILFVILCIVFSAVSCAGLQDSVTGEELEFLEKNGTEKNERSVPSVKKESGATSGFDGEPYENSIKNTRTEPNVQKKSAFTPPSDTKQKTGEKSEIPDSKPLNGKRPFASNQSQGVKPPAEPQTKTSGLKDKAPLPAVGQSEGMPETGKQPASEVQSPPSSIEKKTPESVRPAVKQHAGGNTLAKKPQQKAQPPKKTPAQKPLAKKSVPDKTIRSVESKSAERGNHTNRKTALKPVVPPKTQKKAASPAKGALEKTVQDEDIINSPLFNLEDISETSGTEGLRQAFFSEFPGTEPDSSKEPSISRSVNLYTGQRLELAYPGEGWVYLGESGAQKGIKYQQRKLQNGNTVFNFASEKQGSYILNFSRFDAFSDDFISDSVAVNVEDSAEKMNNTVKAPDFKGSFSTGNAAAETEKKGEITGGAKIIQGSSNKQSEKKSVLSDMPDITAVSDIKTPTAANTMQADSADAALENIRKFIASGKAAEALKALNAFFENYTEKIDEAWFLRGQAYELNGREKNIKQALSSYQTVVKVYPESEKWEEADTRVRYIKKFYVNID